jgi:hypothetical protein
LDDERVNVPSLDVIDSERLPRCSGLYDKDGNKLMAHDARLPAGFVHFRERS